MDPQNDDAILEELRFHEEVAARDVPILRRNLYRLTQAAQVFIGDFTVDANDPLDFMAVHFLDKQVRHAEAVYTLDTHLDTALIARSMMEGLCFLKWSAQDLDRALRWRVFIFIERWRRLRAEPDAASPVQAKAISELRAHLDSFGVALHTRKAREATAAGKRMPEDPFVRTWHDARLEDVFAAVKGQDLYQGPYAFAADWHHWSPSGMQLGMQYEGQVLQRVDRSVVGQAVAFATAFQCLIETAMFIVERFDLPTGHIFVGALRAYQSELDAREESLGSPPRRSGDGMTSEQREPHRDLPGPASSAGHAHTHAHLPETAARVTRP